MILKPPFLLTPNDPFAQPMTDRELFALILGYSTTSREPEALARGYFGLALMRQRHGDAAGALAAIETSWMCAEAA